jgi:hypothetical protein
MNEANSRIALLLKETKQAHHQAYLATDGDDPEWPLWYADYLQDKLPPLLQASLTKSELTYLLVYLSKLQQLEAPGGRWDRYYAKVLVDKYL